MPFGIVAKFMTKKIIGDAARNYSGQFTSDTGMMAVIYLITAKGKIFALVGNTLQMPFWDLF